MSLTAPASHVFLRALTLDAHIGYYAQEKGARQPLVLDIELSIDTQRFGDDKISRTVDYDILARHAHELAASHVDLLETFAERLADRCLTLDHVLAVRVRIEKPRAVPHAMAGVEIVRLRPA